jgi:hypothetical protein
MRPPEIVFLNTTAKLGPGEIAPIAQTKDIPKSNLISMDSGQFKKIKNP